jgi:two-component system phosphate regulon response regulator PhoB
MANILVIEDESEIRNLIKLHLQRDHHQVVAAASIEEIEPALRENTFDLAVVDWMLPGMSGLGFVKYLHTTEVLSPATLMVTAKSAPDDIIEALEAGADDYVVKPFDPGVFMARVRALLRRQTVLNGKARGMDVVSSSLLVVGDIVLDTEKHKASCAGEWLNLTVSEFKLLANLIRNRGRVMTRAMLVAEIQGEGISVVGRTIDTHVFGLRKKLGDSGDLIDTVRGVGYRVKI